jgi:hypothetical protein
MPEIDLLEVTVPVVRLRMAPLIVRAFMDLIFYDCLEAFAGFPRICARVKGTHVKNRPSDSETIERVCNAVDVASCFYFKQVLCMHRSFVAVRLLRKVGVRADLVIGSRPIPFVAHAWAEVDGRVVNDKQGYKRRLIEMERI